jgi:HEAT repeat protein
VGEQKTDSTFSPTEMISIPVRLSDLRAAVADVNQHVWRRTFALNWLTEVYPAEASELLLELATKEASPMVRNAAVLDLGVAKVKAAVQPLMGMAQQSTDEALRRLAIVALGDIGDPASAPAIRPYLNDKDERVAALATDAIGGVRDADSVGTLLAIMKDKSKVKRRDRVGDALAAIGNREAVEGLLAFLRDPKGDMRELAAEKLALTKAPEAIAALVALTNDSNTPAKLHEAILKALGRVGGKEADDAAIAALRSAHAEVRKTAAMGIRESKVAGAVAPLWSAYQAEADKDAGIEIAAALVELKFADKSVVPFLVRRLDAKKNKLWYSDVKLLRHLTDQKFGPESPYGDEKDRDAELSKWREWWQQQPGAQPAP